MRFEARKNDQNKDLIIKETNQYVIVFYPLDGSSNIGAGIPTGAIIGVYKHDDNCINNTENDVGGTANCLKLGTNLVTARPIAAFLDGEEISDEFAGVL